VAVQSFAIFELDEYWRALSGGEEAEGKLLEIDVSSIFMK